MRRMREGQSAMEYIVVVAVAIAALLTTNIYVKRAKMGDLGRATDQIGSQFNPHQYASQFQTDFKSDERRETREFDGLMKSEVTNGQEQQTRQGAERLTQSRLGCEQLFHQDRTGEGSDECPPPEAAPKPDDAAVPDPIGG